MRPRVMSLQGTPVAADFGPQSQGYGSPIILDVTAGGVKAYALDINGVVRQIGGAGGGTVTSVTAGSDLAGSPNPIVGVGTISLAFSGWGRMMQMMGA